MGGLADLLTEDAILGLEIVTSIGDTDGDGDLDQLYIPGARSFSTGHQTAHRSMTPVLILSESRVKHTLKISTVPTTKMAILMAAINNKGPEPEGLTLGVIGDRTYAFVGLERIGGVMVYDITDPMAVSFVTYANNRDFSGDAEAGTAGDLGPEGVLFISAENSPTNANLLVVTNEISGTTTIYEIQYTPHTTRWRICHLVLFWENYTVQNCAFWSL